MSVEPDSRGYGRFDELAQEFAERYRRGERPSVEDYVEILPELADEIREMFPALAAVERVQADAENDALTRLHAPLLKELGDYRIVREIGRGGMGVVYEAEQVSLGRRWRSRSFRATWCATAMPSSGSAAKPRPLRGCTTRISCRFSKLGKRATSPFTRCSSFRARGWIRLL